MTAGREPAGQPVEEETSTHVQTSTRRDLITPDQLGFLGRYATEVQYALDMERTGKISWSETIELHQQCIDVFISAVVKDFFRRLGAGTLDTANRPSRTAEAAADPQTPDALPGVR